MRDRLIELLKDTVSNATKPGSFFGYVADYLLENGVVVPPCKVGDTLYAVTAITQEIVEVVVTEIRVSEHRITIATDHGTVHKKSLWKTVFLTREEAEAAMKGGAEG